RRWARTERLVLTAEERRLYDDVTALVRGRLRSAGAKGGFTRMALIALQMALGSSPEAAAATLRNMAANESYPAADRAPLTGLAERAESVTAGSKADRLLRLVGEFPDKIVLFTQFRATQEMLRRRLGEAGHDVAVFHGGLTRLEKEA